MTTFTASEVRELAATIWPDLSGREEVAETLNAYADLLEAREKAVPVAYALFTEKGLIRMWSREWFADARGAPVNPTPLYAHPTPADTERLAEALRAKIRRLRNMPKGEFQLAASIFADDLERILAAHSAQAQLTINHSDEEPYPDAAKDPFWKVPGMVDTRPKAQPPATRVPGVNAQAHENAQAALAAQENPNG